MKRHPARLIAYLMPVILGGLLLTCSPDEIPSTVTQAWPPTSNAADPALPRNFTLPTPLFAAHSAWNQTVTGADVLPEDEQQILITYRVLCGHTADLRPSEDPPSSTWPFMYLNHDDYSVPVFRMGAGEQAVSLCDYEGYEGGTNPKLPPNPDGTVTVPAPDGTVRPTGPQELGADGHLVLYDPGTFTEYDFWQATTARDGPCQSQGGGLTGETIYEAGAIDFFNASGSGANPDTYFSARATGVPLLAGLLVPEDVEAGAIEHALAFAISGLRNTSADPFEPLPSDYFYPASTTETDFYNVNAHALAAGQRLRLQPSIVDAEGQVIDEASQLRPITRMFLTALRTYGAYVVDNAGGLIFYAEDIHTADLDLDDAQVNALIGAPPGTPLPVDKTKWELVIQTLNQDLELIPFAYGSWTEGQDPATATITTPNFVVVEPAARPALTASLHLPLVLHAYTAPSTSSEVNDFLYQLQNMNLADIGDTAYDLVIMDYSAQGDDESAFSAAQIAALQHSPGGDKIVLAYMSIGEAEDYRFYWDESWDADGDGQPDPGAPLWLDVENPDWAGNYKVHYWDPGWQTIVFSYTNRLLNAGFDGAYLDIIDAYEYYADQGRGSAAQDMVDLVAAIRAHAHDHDPDFYLCPQNAPELATLIPAYLDSVDGIGQEDIYYGYEDDDVATPPAVTAELEGYLDVFKNAGKLVLTVDYATTPEHIDEAYAKSQAQGYVPFVTVRDLDQLIINPGHEPD